MTKQEFVDAVASRANLSRRDAGAAVDAVLDTVTDALARLGVRLRCLYSASELLPSSQNPHG